MSAPLRALPALLLLGAIWDLTPSLGKLLVLAGAGPLTLAALVAALSSALLWAACAARGLRVRWDRAHLRYYAVGGASASRWPTWWPMPRCATCRRGWWR